MAVRDILLLGNPLLNRRCESVLHEELSDAIAVGRDLHDTLMQFRAAHGWGRAIAAPQIGMFKRIVYLHMHKSWLLINPTVTDLSDKGVEIWDDCMSFPEPPRSREASRVIHVMRSGPRDPVTSTGSCGNCCNMNRPFGRSACRIQSDRRRFVCAAKPAAPAARRSFRQSRKSVRLAATD